MSSVGTDKIPEGVNQVLATVRWPSLMLRTSAYVNCYLPERSLPLGKCNNVVGLVGSLEDAQSDNVGTSLEQIHSNLGMKGMLGFVTTIWFNFPPEVCP